MEKLIFSDQFLYKSNERIIPGSVSQAALSEHFARYLFAKKYSQGKRVLNVASGCGYGSEILNSSAREIFNIDISEQLVAYGNLNYGNYKNHFLTMDAQKMAFPDKYFDLIVTFETFEHLPKYSNFLTECHRVLKDNGKIILSMPNKKITSPSFDKPVNMFHFKEWTIEEFERIIDGKYQIDRFYGQNFTTPNHYSKLFSITIFQKLLNFLYQNIPATIFKFIKKHYLKFKVYRPNEVRLDKKDKINNRGQNRKF